MSIRIIYTLDFHLVMAPDVCNTINLPLGRSDGDGDVDGSGGGGGGSGGACSFFASRSDVT